MTGYFGSVNAFLRDALTGVAPEGRGKTQVVAIPIARSSNLARAQTQVGRKFDAIETYLGRLIAVSNAEGPSRLGKGRPQAHVANRRGGGPSNLEAAALTLGALYAFNNAQEIAKWTSKQVEATYDTIKRGVKDTMSWFGDALGSAKDAVTSSTARAAASIRDGIAAGITAGRDFIASGYESLRGYASQVTQSLDGFWSGIKSYAESFNASLTGLRDVKPADPVGNKTQDVEQTATNFWTSVYTGAQSWITRLINTFRAWSPDGGAQAAPAGPPPAKSNAPDVTPPSMGPAAGVGVRQGRQQAASPYGGLPTSDAFSGGTNDAARQPGGSGTGGGARPAAEGGGGAVSATQPGSQGSPFSGGVSSAPAQVPSVGADSPQSGPSRVLGGSSQAAGASPSASSAPAAAVAAPGGSGLESPAPAAGNFRPIQRGSSLQGTAGQRKEGIFGPDELKDELGSVKDDTSAAAGLAKLGENNVQMMSSPAGRSFLNFMKDQGRPDYGNEVNGVYTQRLLGGEQHEGKVFLSNVSEGFSNTVRHELGHAAAHQTRKDVLASAEVASRLVSSGVDVNDLPERVGPMSRDNLRAASQLMGEGAWFSNRTQEEARQRWQDLASGRVTDQKSKDFAWGLIKRYTAESGTGRNEMRTGDDFRLLRHREGQVERANAIVQNHSADFLAARQAESTPVAEAPVEPAELPTRRVDTSAAPVTETQSSTDAPAGPTPERQSRLEYLSTDPGVFVVDIGAYA